MTATIARTATTTRTRRPAQRGGLRLRLKPAGSNRGVVQGAWWPRSTVLSAELPSLLPALSHRFGPIRRVRYHAADWFNASLPAACVDGVDVEDTASSPHVLSLSGPDFDELTLLVVPPYTEAARAYEAVVSAANAGDASTPERLLGIPMKRTPDTLAALIALERWETDGGATPVARA